MRPLLQSSCFKHHFQTIAPFFKSVPLTPNAVDLRKTMEGRIAYGRQTGTGVCNTPSCGKNYSSGQQHCHRGEFSAKERALGGYNLP
jgi:hypothetical protein